jgi:hypothetical protein
MTGITGFTSQSDPAKNNVAACTDNQPAERPGPPGMNWKTCSSIVTGWSCFFAIYFWPASRDFTTQVLFDILALGCNAASVNRVGSVAWRRVS